MVRLGGDWLLLLLHICALFFLPSPAHRSSLHPFCLGIHAIVETFYPSLRGAEAIARSLFGQYNK
jgi:hypothetical protein